MNPRLGIRSRFWLAAALPAFLSVVALLAFFSYRYDSELFQAWQDRTRASTSQLAVASEFPLFAGDRAALSRLLEASMVGDPNLVASGIFDSAGEPVGVIGRFTQALPLFRSEMVLVSGARTLLCVVPVGALRGQVDDPFSASLVAEGSGQSQNLGYVALEVNLDAMRESRFNLLVWAAAVTLLALLLALSAASVMAASITGPIDRIGRGVAEIGAGSSEVRIATEGTGVLQPLAEGINHMAARVSQAQRELQALSGHHEDEINEERRQIAMDVHDELGQLLTAMKLQLDALKARAQGRPEIEHAIASLSELVRDTMEVARNIAMHLRPPALDLGLGAALEWLAEDFSLRSEVVCTLQGTDLELVLSDRQATTLYRIVQEALSNVARHAQARRVHISLQRTSGRLALSISDDGTGFDPDVAAAKGHFGLFGVRERALRLGGQLKLQTQPGTGTALHFDFPYPIPT